MDDFFNHRYAREVEELISKMDPDAAAMLSLMVAHDVTHQHIDDNRRTVNSHVEKCLSEVRDVVAKALLRKNDDSPNAVATAALVGVVSKADEFEWDRKNPWVRRDKGGRFSGSGGGSYKMTVREDKSGNRKLKVTEKAPKGDYKARQFDVTGGLGRTSQEASAFQQAWNKPTDPRTNDRTYGRIQAGSKIMRDVGMHTGNAPLALAGEMGNFAGSFGPEAERVVGPSLRKTAYRYRGTERRVDPELSRRVNEGVAALRRRVGADNNGSAPAQLPGDLRTPVAQQAAIGYLSSKLPDKKLADLQIQSGKIPPSQGVMINADGKVVAQAVGYMEDHYLPFNLKNLKGLQGGSYVRTRSSGGLTSEDIYTGLMAGARSVTVVSRSGVFTVEFEDDFRGQRRYSDKARQMVGRYKQTLDAVGSGKVVRRPLSAKERVQIREEVENEYSFMGDSAESRQAIEQTIKERSQLYENTPRLTREEIDTIEHKALEAAASHSDVRSSSTGGKSDRAVGGVGSKQAWDGATTEQRYKYYRAEMMDAAMEDKRRRVYQLDAEGYETAARALKEQFPYFIKDARHTPLNERTSTETDQGYVRHNYLRPKAVREGYFDEEIEGTGKYSAASTNHQNYANRQNLKAAPAESDESEKAPATGAKAAAQAAAKTKEERAEVERQIEADDAGREMLKFTLAQLDENVPDGWELSKIRKDMAALEPAKQDEYLNNLLKDSTRMQDVLSETTKVNFNDDYVTRRFQMLSTKWEDKKKAVKSVTISDDWDGRSPDRPGRFPELDSMSPEQMTRQLAQLNAMPKMPQGDDAALKMASETYGVVGRAMDDIARTGKYDYDSVLRMMLSAKVDTQRREETFDLLDQITKMPNRAESAAGVAKDNRMMQRNIELKRALMARIGVAETPAATKTEPEEKSDVIRGELIPKPVDGAAGLSQSDPNKLRSTYRNQLIAEFRAYGKKDKKYEEWGNAVAEAVKNEDSHALQAALATHNIPVKVRRAAKKRIIDSKMGDLFAVRSDYYLDPDDEPDDDDSTY